VGRHVFPRTIVSVSQHYKNPTKRVGFLQSGYHYFNVYKRVLTMIELQNCSFGIQRQSLTLYYNNDIYNHYNRMSMFNHIVV